VLGKEVKGKGGRDLCRNGPVCGAKALIPIGREGSNKKNGA